MDEKPKVTKPLGALKSTGAKRAEPGKSTAGNQDLEAGKIAPMGVGLTEGERAALKAIAAQYEGLTPNALMRYALRRFIVEVRAGNIDLEQELVQVPQKKRLRLPS